MLILHVDDSVDWLENVQRALIGIVGIELVSVASLSLAVGIHEKRKPDWVICDGSIDYSNDGIKWAEKLYAQGQKVIILTARVSFISYVPFLSKYDFSQKGLSTLLGL